MWWIELKCKDENGEYGGFFFLIEIGDRNLIYISLI